MIRNNGIWTFCVGGLAGAALFVGCASKPTETTITKIKRHQASDMEQLSHVGNFWIAEQPTERDLIWMRDNAVTMVIDVRTREEDRGFDERAYVIGLGMMYSPAPLEVSQDYTIRYFDIIRQTLRDRAGEPTLIHGDSANRAAAVWMTYRVLDDKIPYAEALSEARIAGLDNEDTLAMVDQYLLDRNVDISPQVDLNDSDGVTTTSVDGPNEVIYTITEDDAKSDDAKSDDAKSDTRRD